MIESLHGRPLGPVMCDVAGVSLSAEERQMLQHPLVGGVILFARNFSSIEQLRQLTAEIQSLRDPALIIAVDHEGGRVQRFRQGFTALPTMRVLGELWQQDSNAAQIVARQTGYVLAAELLACGVSLSFTPVLDLDYGRSAVIGDRAFHREPKVVQALAQALVAGLREAGMGAVGKHFPGHGYAEADSHVALPEDTRSFEAIWNEDIAPYRHPLGGQLSGVMPAHVIYSQADTKPAGFSSFWLQDVLRGRLGYKGVIFSDDLTMEGATVAGGIVERADAALAAGCDMVLVCNHPELTQALLAQWQPKLDAASMRRLAKLTVDPSWRKRPALAQSACYLAARQQLLAWQGSR